MNIKNKLKSSSKNNKSIGDNLRESDNLERQIVTLNTLLKQEYKYKTSVYYGTKTLSTNYGLI